MSDPKEEARDKIKKAALISWIIGSFVIFMVASVTYSYLGLEGEFGFQLSGLMVAVIIAHYTHRIITVFNKESRDKDVQE